MPPTLSARALKDLGTTFCDLQAEQLVEDTLMNKSKLELVGKKMKKNKEHKEGKKNQNEEKDDERKDRNEEQ